MEIEDRWQQIPIAYRDRVYRLFHSLPIGEPFIIADRVSPENQTAFKIIAAYFIRWNEGKMFGFSFEFNNGYDKIRKLHYSPFIASKQKDGEILLPTGESGLNAK